MSNVLISVIVPAYNQADYLVEAINSVLAQSLSPSEIIVINDHSTDHTHEVIQPLLSHITYIRQEKNQGAGFARNIGVNHARGQFIAFLDSDDYWAADKLNRQYQMMQHNPSLDFVFSHTQHFHSPDLSKPLKLKLYCAKYPVVDHRASSFFGRRSSFLKVGYLNTTLKNGEFTDWYLRAKKMNCKIGVDQATTVFRRIHQGHAKKNYTDYFSVFKNELWSEESSGVSVEL